MVDPEYYLGAYRGPDGRWSTAKFSDTADVASLAEADMKVRSSRAQAPANRGPLAPARCRAASGFVPATLAQLRGPSQGWPLKRRASLTRSEVLIRLYGCSAVYRHTLRGDAPVAILPRNPCG